MTKAKNWAIVVGVNAYKNIGRLEYANRDAEAMHDFFVKAKFDRVFWFADGITLPSSSEQHSTDPTSSDLVDFLHDRFSTKVPPLAPGDNCWFFFAGHGKRIDDCDYLLPIDYNPRLADHEKRAISVNFVRERLLKSGADNVILLLDACRTEGDRADGLGIGDVQPGAITIFSCQRNRKAYEIEALRQGAFTAALLEALQMPGERNCATVERLDLYLQCRVPQICKQHQKPEQVPVTYVEPRQKSYLILLPEFATDQDVALLRSEAQDAELEETLEIAEQLWIRVIAATRGQDLRALQAYARVWGKKNNQRSPLPIINTTYYQETGTMNAGNITGGFHQDRSISNLTSRVIVQPAQVPDMPRDRDLVALWQKILSNVEEIPARAILSSNCYIVEMNGKEIKIGIIQKSSLVIVKARSAQLGKACAKTLKGGVKMTFIVAERESI